MNAVADSPYCLFSKCRSRASVAVMMCVMWWVGLLPLQAEESDKPDKAEAALDQAIKECREGVIGITLNFEETQTFWHFCGVVINDEGWAVLPLRCIAYREKPQIWNSSREPVGIQKILAVDLVNKLGLVQLDSKDLKPIRLAEKRAELREPAAMLWWNMHEDLRGVMRGPVMAYRRSYPKGPNAAPFLSIGAWFNPGAGKGDNAPVINARGELLGVHTGTHSDNPGLPKILMATTAEEIKKLIAKAQKNPEGIPFPLKGIDDYDEAYWAYNLHPSTVKRYKYGVDQYALERDIKGMKGEQETLASIERQYPNSKWIQKGRMRAIQEEVQTELMVAYEDFMKTLNAEDGERVMEMLKNAEDEAMKAFKEHGIDEDLIAEVKSGSEIPRLLVTKDYKALASACEKRLKEWGDNPPAEIYGWLAFAQAENGNIKEATENHKRAIALAPDSIYFLQAYEFFLNRHYNAEEAAWVTKKIWELEDIYAPR